MTLKILQWKPLKNILMCLHFVLLHIKTVNLNTFYCNILPYFHSYCWYIFSLELFDNLCYSEKSVIFRGILKPKILTVSKRGHLYMVKFKWADLALRYIVIELYKLKTRDLIPAAVTKPLKPQNLLLIHFLVALEDGYIFPCSNWMLI